MYYLIIWLSNSSDKAVVDIHYITRNGIDKRIYAKEVPQTILPALLRFTKNLVQQQYIQGWWAYIYSINRRDIDNIIAVVEEATTESTQA